MFQNEGLCVILAGGRGESFVKAYKEAKGQGLQTTAIVPYSDRASAGFFVGLSKPSRRQYLLCS
jgi:hypothetical protein